MGQPRGRKGASSQEGAEAVELAGAVKARDGVGRVVEAARDVDS